MDISLKDYLYKKVNFLMFQEYLCYLSSIDKVFGLGSLGIKNLFKKTETCTKELKNVGIRL